MRRRFSIVIATAAIATTLLLDGCEQSGPLGPTFGNEPPSAWISSGPPEGSETNYRVRFFWGGYDVDGEIAYYEYAITDNDGFFDPRDVAGDDAWTRIDRKGGTFTFTADEPLDDDPDDPLQPFGRSHTFLIRAVDNRGARSVPAHRSFTATTLAPTAEITVPCDLGDNIPSVAPITRFEWRAVDYIDELDNTQPPAEVRWILMRWQWDNMAEFVDYLRANPEAPEWSDWVPYEGGEEGTHKWRTPPLGLGSYVIAVQARDEAGAVTPVFDAATNVRRFRVPSDLPTAGVEVRISPFGSLIVYNSFEGPPTIMDLPAGTPIGFEARSLRDFACTGRYVYIRWTNDVEGETWTEWTRLGTEWVDLEKYEPYFGTLTVRLEIRDSYWFTGAATLKFNIVEFTFEREVLVVDDFVESPNIGIFPSGGAMPSDAEHDAFWADVLADVDGFNPAIDVLDVAQSRLTQIPITLLAQYKSVIWNVKGGADITDPPLLYDVIRYRPRDPIFPGDSFAPNVLKNYMAAGGRVLICGQEPMSLVINRLFIANRVRFPFLFLWELKGRVFPAVPEPVGEESFGYLDYAIDVLDLGLLEPMQERNEGLCAIDRLRNDDLAQSTLRACIPIDVRMGRLELRPEVSGPGQFHAPENWGLVAELYNPEYFMRYCVGDPDVPRVDFEPIFGHESLDETAETFAAPVASWTSVHVDGPVPSSGHARARSAVWGFEPYYFNPDQVKAALDVILFDEWGHSRSATQSAGGRQ